MSDQPEHITWTEDEWSGAVSTCGRYFIEPDEDPETGEPRFLLSTSYDAFPAPPDLRESWPTVDECQQVAESHAARYGAAA